MLSLRSLLLVAVALAASATAAPDASAAVDPRDTFEYSATIETNVDYNSARAGKNHLGPWSSQFDDEFTVKTEIPRIRFTAGFPSYNNPAYSSATATRGHLLMIPAGSGGLQVTCTGTEVEDFAGAGLMGVPTPGAMQFKLRVVNGITRRLPQCSSILPQFVWRYDMLGAPLGEGYFDTTLTFPSGRLGSDHTQQVRGGVSGPKCPGYSEDTEVCVLTWDATITFRHLKTDRTPEVPVDDDAVPQPGQPPSPPIRPVPRTKAFTVDAAKLDLAAGSVVVPVACASACSGVATASLPSGRARAAAKPPKRKARPLATARFQAAAGTTAKVVLRIPKAKRAAVRRAKALRLTLVVTPQGGRAVTETLTVKPRRAK